VLIGSHYAASIGTTTDDLEWPCMAVPHRALSLR